MSIVTPTNKVLDLKDFIFFMLVSLIAPCVRLTLEKKLLGSVTISIYLKKSTQVFWYQS